MAKRTNRRFQFSLFAMLGLMGAAALAAAPLSLMFRAETPSNTARGVGVMLLTAGPVLAVLAAGLALYVRDRWRRL